MSFFFVRLCLLLQLTFAEPLGPELVCSSANPSEKSYSGACAVPDGSVSNTLLQKTTHNFVGKLDEAEGADARHVVFHENDVEEAADMEADLSTTASTTPMPVEDDVDPAADAQDHGEDTDWDIEDQGTIEKLEADVDDNDTNLIDVGQTDVLCGGHRAPTCTDCPQGHGSSWCHGDCVWNTQDGVCEDDARILTSSNPFGCSKNNGLCKARTASIHFNYMRPPGARTPSWLYNQLTPRQTSDATFFAIATTGYGYAGIQTVWKDESRDKDRAVICSIWDQKTGSAKMEKCGDDVYCKGFGGEGTGAKAMWYFDWQLGHHYAFMLHRQIASDGSGRVEHSCWFYAEELEHSHPGGWKHIATATSGANGYGTTFADSGSFLEQWTHKHSEEKRHGEFGPAYYKNENGEWYQSKQTKFSVAYDRTRLETEKVRIDRVSAGQAQGTKRLYMHTGGNAQVSEDLSRPRYLGFPQAPCALPASLYMYEATKDVLLGHGNIVTSSSVVCGGHRASTCAGCPFDKRRNMFHGMSWCNGHCVWKHQQCMRPNSSPCPPNGVRCGGHRSASCNDCPYASNGHYHGRGWCNGECSWTQGSCRDK